MKSILSDNNIRKVMKERDISTLDAVKSMANFSTILIEFMISKGISPDSFMLYIYTNHNCSPESTAEYMKFLRDLYGGDE